MSPWPFLKPHNRAQSSERSESSLIGFQGDFTQHASVRMAIIRLSVFVHSNSVLMSSLTAFRHRRNWKEPSECATHEQTSCFFSDFFIQTLTEWRPPLLLLQFKYLSALFPLIQTNRRAVKSPGALWECFQMRQQSQYPNGFLTAVLPPLMMFFTGKKKKALCCRENATTSCQCWYMNLVTLYFDGLL